MTKSWVYAPWSDYGPVSIRRNLTLLTIAAPLSGGLSSFIVGEPMNGTRPVRRETLSENDEAEAAAGGDNRRRTLSKASEGLHSPGPKPRRPHRRRTGAERLPDAVRAGRLKAILDRARPSSQENTMLFGKSPTAPGAAASLVLVELIRLLIEKKVLTNEDAADLLKSAHASVARDGRTTAREAKDILSELHKEWRW